jgi:hypothetical protein
MNFLRVQIDNAIANGRIAMRIEIDKRDWLKQAIEKGRSDLSVAQLRALTNSACESNPSAEAVCRPAQAAC